tara:strand:+ start:11058 stop:11960 length:903 start_codon:yes stop_codon:yes gene_type:complete
MKKNSNQNIYKHRKIIYEKLRNSKYVKDDKDILIKFRLNNFSKEIGTIKKKIETIILKSLKEVHKRKFKTNNNFLKKYYKEIISLPNITPNGAFQPKKEIIKEYNSFHKSIIKLLKKLGLFKNIERAMHIVIRIKKGSESNSVKNRSYATNKIHSDAWSGMAMDSVLMIMLFGDINNNTVDCYKPINFNKNILKKLKKFDQGKNYYEKIEHITKINKNELVVFDQLCLHKSSITKNAGPRISVDLGIDWKKPKLNYKFKKKSKRYQKFRLNKWAKLDYKLIKNNNLSFSDAKHYKNYLLN